MSLWTWSVPENKLLQLFMHHGLVLFHLFNMLLDYSVDISVIFAYC